jgi:Flp pilus assembly pilin Flp
MLKRLWREDEGVLTFEWILLVTLLVIGIVGGVAGIRDAIIHEAQGITGAMVSLDQSYFIAPPLALSVSDITNVAGVNCTSGAASCQFSDSGDFAVGRQSNTPTTAYVADPATCPVPLPTIY